MLCTGLLLFGGNALSADTPSADKDKKPPATSPPSQPAAPPVKTIDMLRLPSDAIVVVVEKVADGLKMAPGMLLLKPEKYREMIEELEHLRAKLRSERGGVSLYHIEGEVDGPLVMLKVRYELGRQRADSWVALGCKQAIPIRASLEGRTPLLRMSETEGYLAQIDHAGDDVHLTVWYSLSLTSTGSQRSLELDLPRAAGNTIKLTIPGEVKDLRINDRPRAETQLVWKDGVLEGPHGPDAPSKLQITWKGPNANVGGPTVLTAEGQVEVRIDEQMQQTTKARLVLKVQGGPTKQFRLLVPEGAFLEFAPADDARVTVETQKLQNQSIRTIKLKEPSADPLVVTVTTPPRPITPHPGGQRLAVGPIALLGAPRQMGTLTISSAAPALQLMLHRQVSILPRAPTAEELKLAPLVRTFSYQLPPLSDQPPFVDQNTDSASLRLVDLEPELLRGRLTARLMHHLRLPPVANRGDRRAWVVDTQLEAQLLQPGVDQLEVQLPPDWDPPLQEGRLVFESQLPEPVQQATYDSKRHVVVLQFARDGWKTFQLTIRAHQQKSVGDTVTQSIELPRVLGVVSTEGFKVTASVPRDLELTVPAHVEPLLELTQEGPQKQVWQLERTAERVPDRVDLSWQPYHPQVRARSLVDLTLTGRQAMVQQVISLQFPGPPPDHVTLLGPADVLTGLRVLEGGQLLSTANDRSARQVELRKEEGGRRKEEKEDHIVPPSSFLLPPSEVRLVLHYFLPLSGKDSGRLQTEATVGFVNVAGVTRNETRVRVLTEPGGPPPVAVGSDWAVMDLELVAGRNVWPALVLNSTRRDPALTLRWSSPGGDHASPAALIERALIRVNVVEGSGQFYRASFRLRQVLGGGLDIELPGPAVGLGLQAFQDAMQISSIQVREDPEGKQGADGVRQIAHLTLVPTTTPSILDIYYQLPPAGQVGRGGGVIQTTLQPPKILGIGDRLLTRWQLTSPANWVVLSPEAGPGMERVWVRRGLLLSTRPTATGSDLEHWLAGNETYTFAGESDTWEPSVLCWRRGLEPLAVIHVPQQGWLLFSSLLVLLLGLGLWFLARRFPNPCMKNPNPKSQIPKTPVFFGIWDLGFGILINAGIWNLGIVGMALFAMALVTMTVFYPTLMSAVFYGTQPGLAVLLVLCTLLWWIQEQHRRRTVFLPSFSRSRNGSSLIRTPAPQKRGESSGNRRHGEPSTVDVPRQIN